MLRLLVIAIVLIAYSVGLARAAPPGARVVLVDPDPELRRATTTALRPWKLEVIVDATPVDEAGAAARADALGARFVVWRHGKDLLVFDRERGETQHREAPSGALDPVDAAAAALTVKTLMRLPPPPPEETKPPPPRPPPPPPAVTLPPSARGSEIRVQAGGAMRVAKGSETVVGGRFVGAALVRPLADAGWRFGLLGDLGPAASFARANFDGRWSDWSLLIIASWTHVRGRLEIEPFVAAGITRSRVEGADANMGMGALTLDERDTLPAIRSGGWVRYRIGEMWTLGASLSIEAVSGTPTYTRTGNPQPLYEVPGFGVTLGVVLATDLGW